MVIDGLAQIAGDCKPAKTIIATSKMYGIRRLWGSYS